MRVPAPVRWAGRGIDRVVRSATVERVGGGLLVGGLVWGFLKVAASNFPTAPLIVATLGAFLLAAGLTGNLINRFAPAPAVAEPQPAPRDGRSQDGQKRELRKRLLFVKGELETVAHITAGPPSPYYWKPLSDEEWQKARNLFAGTEGFSGVYSTIHNAYMGVDQANHLAQTATDMERFWTEEDLDALSSTEVSAMQAINAIKEQLDALEAGS